MLEAVSEEEFGSREMYAAYGTAMFQAQVLEHRLTYTIGLARTAAKEFRTREELHASFESNYTATLGTLLHHLRPYIDDASLEAELTAALETRNRLAHHFFWEHQDDLETIEGLANMSDEAYQAQLQFQALIEKLTLVLLRFIDTIGQAPDEHIPGLTEAVELALDALGPSDLPAMPNAI